MGYSVVPEGLSCYACSGGRGYDATRTAVVAGVMALHRWYQSIWSYAHSSTEAGCTSLNLRHRMFCAFRPSLVAAYDLRQY
eukprot:3186331-Rhodomonas_salina.2